MFAVPMRIVSIVCFCLVIFGATPAAGAAPRLQIRLDTGEAEAALTILDRQHNGLAIRAADWRRLFASEGYRRVRDRETAMRRSFEDDAMRAFLTAPEQVSRAPMLRQALEDWRDIALDEAADAAFAYLPAEASIRAVVYIVIKPRANSFVFGIPDDPGIFLSLNPAQSRAVTQNTIAHEMHHIGFGTACPPADVAPREEPTHEARLRTWLGAYGEGFAMLAAAGGPDIHPHANSPEEDRARWDRDVARYREDATEQNAFFMRVMSGELADVDAIDAQARTYFGVQGPWYTVGWRMAVSIERAFGRPRLIEAMCGQNNLLATYNAAAAVLGEPALWDAGLAARLGGE